MNFKNFLNLNVFQGGTPTQQPAQQQIRQQIMVQSQQQQQQQQQQPQPQPQHTLQPSQPGMMPNTIRQGMPMQQQGQTFIDDFTFPDLM